MSAKEIQEMLVPFFLDTGEAVVVIVLTMVLYALAHRGIHRMQQRGKLAKPVTTVCLQIMRWLFLLVGLLLVLQAYGVLNNAWAALTTMLGLVAIGFVAVWSILSNVLCSVILLAVRPFQVDDTLELPGAGLRGRVVNFNMIFTRFETEDGATIQVPNNLFFQQAVKRWAGASHVQLDEQLTKDEDYSA